MAARADIGRYVVLDVCGGVYADMDTVCVRPVNRLLRVTGPSLYVQVYDNPSMPVSADKRFEHVANSIIACVPRHPIWKDVFERILKENNTGPWWILSTGPHMFSQCARRISEATPGDIQLLGRDNILTAYYLPRHYMRWYAFMHRDICVLDYNESARRGARKALRLRLWPKRG